MHTEIPKLVAINHDDYHAKHVGTLSNGRQFFLTAPFEPASGNNPGCEYVALFLFGSEGDFIDAKIENLGPRKELDEIHAQKVYDKLLSDLGDVTFQRIEVAPFSVERFGTKFGLILREPEDDADVWAVELQPGNFMAFFEPWDSGDYDT
jgi:hypothetical protein